MGVANKEISQGKLFILSGKVRENEFCKVVGTQNGMHQFSLWLGCAEYFMLLAYLQQQFSAEMYNFQITVTELQLKCIQKFSHVVPQYGTAELHYVYCIAGGHESVLCQQCRFQHNSTYR